MSGSGVKRAGPTGKIRKVEMREIAVDLLGPQKAATTRVTHMQEPRAS
jgi:hypothetical protein